MDAAVEIGKVFEEARHKRGYSRNAVVQTKKLRGKLTSEGLRKIEKGERVPRFETIRTLAEAFELPESQIRKLETKALELTVERTAKKLPRSSVSFQVKGAPLRIIQRPKAEKKQEAFVRGVVEELVDMIHKYGVMEADETHFRQFARNTIYKHMTR